VFELPELFPLWLIVIFFALAVWEMVWKGMALWKAAQAKESTWFICLLIFNTVGILPIIYLKFINKK
jgi:hypothetical protein